MITRETHVRDSALSSPVAPFHNVAPALLEPKTPGWVDAAMPHAEPINVGEDVPGRRTGPLTLLTASVPQAGRMTADEFRAAVHRAYCSLGTTLTAIEQTAIRLWNYMPDPGAPLSTALDRYMVFNQGRSAGYAAWLGERGPFSASLPTASAVGVEGDVFVVHCLAAAEPGTPVENPRQISSWRYSSRYGPTPPSFSRATVATIAGTARLLIGGTASIVGEDTMHVGSIAGQLDETLNNLAALIATARSERPSQALSHLRDVRVYMTRPADAGFVRHTLESRCPRLDRVELAVTRLCRPELLIEIEGVADLN